MFRTASVHWSDGTISAGVALGSWLYGLAVGRTRPAGSMAPASLATLAFYVSVAAIEQDTHGAVRPAGASM
ncbi:MAG: hypothetical protein L0Z62_44985, partial [Gemmataceae bacterium]|nr:hypothetical protein [Gemmataceae bacterium]